MYTAGAQHGMANLAYEKKVLVFIVVAAVGPRCCRWHWWDTHKCLEWREQTKKKEKRFFRSAQARTRVPELCTRAHPAIIVYFVQLQVEYSCDCANCGCVCVLVSSVCVCACMQTQRAKTIEINREIILLENVLYDLWSVALPRKNTAHGRLVYTRCAPCERRRQFECEMQWNQFFGGGAYVPYDEFV